MLDEQVRIPAQAAVLVKYIRSALEELVLGAKVASPQLSLESGSARVVVDTIARLCIEDEATAKLGL